MLSVEVNIDAGGLREAGSELALDVNAEVLSISEEAPLILFPLSGITSGNLLYWFR